MIEIDEEINRALNEYNIQVLEAIDKKVKSVSKQVVKELKTSSPTRTGKYKRSWTKKDKKVSNLSTSSIIYNKRYRLTHLLENGHALVSGGRTRAYIHIKPAEERAIVKFKEEVEDAIKNI